MGRPSLGREARALAAEKNGEEITAQNGRYGPYIKQGKESRSLEREDQLFTVTLEEALAILPRLAARRPAASAARRMMPAAQMSLGVRAATLLNQAPGGLGTTLHWVPSQCSTRTHHAPLSSRESPTSESLATSRARFGARSAAA